jgi:hypothetical protein
LCAAIFGSVSLSGATAEVAHAQLPTITFVNNSGRTALVKLVGPSEQTVQVLNGESKTVNASGGSYYILTRYGDTPNTYTYFRGNPFTVTETSYGVSIITITLQKVIGRNYGTREISAQEFAAGRP